MIECAVRRPSADRFKDTPPSKSDEESRKQVETRPSERQLVTKRNCMNLLDFPDEILSEISEKLDVETMVKFEQAHPRIRDVSRSTPKTVITKRLSRPILDYFKKAGSMVRTLNLFGCLATEKDVVEAVQNCPRVVNLLLMNAAPHYEKTLELLEPMRDLKKLAFSLHADEYFKLNVVQKMALQNIYELSIIVLSDFFLLKLSVDMINACPSLQVCNLDIVGEEDYFTDFVDDTMPKFSDDLFEAMESFVCSYDPEELQKVHEKFLSLAFSEKSPVRDPERTIILDNSFMFSNEE